MMTPHQAPPLPAIERTLGRWTARQLSLFNSAHRMDDHANAIRLLYLLWEDPALRPPETEDFRYVRNFVSHSRIDGRDTVVFIEPKLGKGTVHYEPFNQVHHDFVRDWRACIQQPLDTILRQQFGLSLPPVTDRVA
jgi:hypothetical protein